MKTKQRFIDRIGKRVYRKSTSCSCKSCKNNCVYGIVIENELLASCLFDVYCDCQTDYFDTREEVLDN